MTSSRNCTVEGCDRPYRCTGFCGLHYSRFLKYGDPSGHAIKYGRLATPGERFWAKVDTSSECWIWTAAKQKGYGHFVSDGHHYRAHRVAYEWLVGSIPAGLQIDHLCRNRACVNPDHMEPVTRKENIARGFSLSARRKRQTHCQRGHEFDPVNTYIDKLGRRNCRTCGMLRARARRAAA